MKKTNLNRRDEDFSLSQISQSLKRAFAFLLMAVMIGSLTIPFIVKTDAALNLNNNAVNKIDQYDQTYSVTYYKGTATDGSVPSSQSGAAKSNITLRTNTGNLIKVNGNYNTTIRVTLNANGGSCASSYVDGKKTRMEYLVCDGWSTTSGGALWKSLGANIALLKNYSLYPHFNCTANKYTYTNVTLPTATKTGYTLDGWNTKSDGTGTTYATGSRQFQANTTLYAKWKINTYTISYSKGTATGGSVPANQTKNYGSNIVLQKNTGSLTKSNTTANTTYTLTLNASGGSVSPSSLNGVKTNTTTYSFSQWNSKSDGSGTNYSAGGTYTGNSNLTLYPKFTSNTTTTKQATVTLPTATKSGYTFKGWQNYDDMYDGNTNIAAKAGDTWTLVANETLYAVFVKDATITYKSDGASTGTAPSSQTVASGGSVTLRTNTGNLAKNTSTSTSNVPVSLTLKFDINTGTSSAVALNNVVENSNATKTTTTTYTFSGWATSSGGSKAYDAGQTLSNVTANKTLYPAFSSSASSSIANQTIKAQIPSNYTCTKQYYVFDGWNTKADGSGTSYTAGATYGAQTSITLYPKWSSSTSTTTQATVVLPTPTKSGYTFMGWQEYDDMYAGSSNVSAKGGNTWTLTSNETLYAVWHADSKVSFDRNTPQTDTPGGNMPSPITYAYGGSTTLPGYSGISKVHEVTASLVDAISYTINYNLNGASGSVTSTSGYSDIDITNRTTYQAVGWNTNASGTGTTYTAGASYSAQGNTTLYVKWDSGTKTTIYPKVNVSATVTSTTPTRTGYTFAGWNTKADGSGTPYSAGNTMNYLSSNGNSGSTTLYAQWTAKTYTVVYYSEAAGSSGSMSNSTLTWDQNGTLRTNLFTRAGYNFIGWDTNEAAASVKYTNGQTVKNITSMSNGTYSSLVELYAVWEPKTFSMSYNANNGSGAPSGTFSAVMNSAFTISSTTPTRSGYKFLGWSLSKYDTTPDYLSGKTYVVDSSWKSNSIFYAVWSKIYTVTLHPNGGTLTGPTTISYCEGDNIEFEKPTRTNYNFVNWYSSQTGGYLCNSTSGMDENFDVYAHWSYTINFNLNGGSSSSTIPSVTKKEGISLTINGFTYSFNREKYTFKGWSASSSATSATYSIANNSALVVNSDLTPVNGIATLYAVWEYNKQPVSDSNGFAAPIGKGKYNLEYSGVLQVLLDSAGNNNCGAIEYVFTEQLLSTAPTSGWKELTGTDLVKATGSESSDKDYYIWWRATVTKYTDKYTPTEPEMITVRIQKPGDHFRLTIINETAAKHNLGISLQKKNSNDVFTYLGVRSLTIEPGTKEELIFAANKDILKESVIEVVVLISDDINDDTNKQRYIKYSKYGNLDVDFINGSRPSNYTGNNFLEGGMNGRISPNQYSSIPNAPGDNWMIVDGYYFVNNNGTLSPTIVLPAKAVTIDAQLATPKYPMSNYMEEIGVTDQSEIFSYVATHFNYYKTSTYADSHDAYEQSYSLGMIENLQDPAKKSDAISDVKYGSKIDQIAATVTAYDVFAKPTIYVGSVSYSYANNYYTYIDGTRTQKGTVGAISFKANVFEDEKATTILESIKTYKGNNPSVVEVVTAPDTVTPATWKVTAPSSTPTGYKYAGYYNEYYLKSDGTYYLQSNGKLQSTGNKIYTGTEYTAKRSVVLMPAYTANQYTVVYDGNGATGGSTANQACSYGSTYQYKTCGYTKTGYVFVGWNSKADGTGTSYSAGTSFSNLSATQGATITVYAQWGPTSVVINYNGNGATSNTFASQTFVYNKGGSLTGNISRTGYNFVQWKANDTSATTFEKNATVPNSFINSNDGKTITLTAQWSPILYSITYNLNGGSVASANPATYNIETTTFTLNNPTKVGYTFTGWTYSGQSTPVKTVSVAKGSTGDKTFTANWSPISYTISYTLNGGSVATANPTSYNIETASFTLNNPTRTGYDFTGWTWSGQTTPVKTVTIEKGSTGNKAYTANWSATTYTITYNLNSGTATNPTSYTIETADFTLNNPTRTGYTFKGWSGTGLSGDSNTSVKISKGSTGNRTYTANWTANKFTVKFNGNSATGGSMSNQTFSYGTAQNLSANAFVRKYTITFDANGGNAVSSKTVTYTFAGWNTKADGTGTAYTNMQSVSNLSSTDGAVITLYAQWTPVSTTLPSGSKDSSSSSVDVKFYNGSTLLETKTVSRPITHSFVGWYNGDTAITSPYTPTADITLTAKYTTSYGAYNSITLPSATKESDVSDITTTLIDGNGNTSTVKTQKTVSYTMKGWYNSSTGSTKYGTAGETYTPLGVTTMYAQFTTNDPTYSSTTLPQTASKDDVVTPYKLTLYDALSDSKLGEVSANKVVKYSFTKWNSKSDGSGTSYSAGATYKPTANNTLYAQFSSTTTQPSVTIPSFTPKGKVEETITSRFYYDSTLFKTLTSKKTTTYSFAGYSTTKTGDIVLATTATTVNPITYPTLYVRYNSSDDYSSITVPSEMPSKIVIERYKGKTDGKTYTPGQVITPHASQDYIAKHSEGDYKFIYTIRFFNTKGITISGTTNNVVEVLEQTMYTMPEYPATETDTCIAYSSKQDMTATGIKWYSARKRYVVTSDMDIYCQWISDVELPDPIEFAIYVRNIDDISTLEPGSRWLTDDEYRTYLEEVLRRNRERGR